MCMRKEKGVEHNDDDDDNVLIFSHIFFPLYVSSLPITTNAS